MPVRRVGDPLAGTGAVVVHHRHFPEVLGTVSALLDAGLPPGSIVLVDNSVDEAIADGLRASLPPGVVLECTVNLGYAHAVNTGVSILARVTPSIILVLTHEVRPEPGALKQLVQTVADNPQIGAAGPTLHLPGTSGAPGDVWSTGGSLSKVWGWPGHQRDPVAPRPVERAWLDGSLCAYRAEALAEGLREDFFLYVEELEFHRRLRERGWRIVWDPAARSVQDTQGAPPYLLGRNLQLYYDAWGTRLQRAAAVPTLIARQALVRVLHRRRPFAATAAAWRGWHDGRARRNVPPQERFDVPSGATARY